MLSTFAISITDVAWTPPPVGADDAIGTSNFACFGQFVNGQEYPYKMFIYSNDINSSIAGVNPATYEHGMLGFWSATPIKIKTITVTNTTQNSYQLRNGVIQGSNDTTTGLNGNWATVATYSNPSQTASATWNIDLSDNNHYYKAYRFYMDTGYNYQRIGYLKLEAYARSNPDPVDFAWAAPSESRYYIAY